MMAASVFCCLRCCRDGGTGHIPLKEMPAVQLDTQHMGKGPPFPRPNGPPGVGRRAGRGQCGVGRTVRGLAPPGTAPRSSPSDAAVTGFGLADLLQTPADSLRPGSAFKATQPCLPLSPGDGYEDLPIFTEISAELLPPLTLQMAPGEGRGECSVAPPTVPSCRAPVKTCIFSECFRSDSLSYLDSQFSL